MGNIFKKLKDVLFDEEEYTEQIKITPEMRNDDTSSREVVVNTHKEEPKVSKSEVREERKSEPISERDLFKTESSFPFFDFDEDEFERQKPTPKPEPKPTPKSYMDPPSKPKSSALDYEINHKTVVKTDYGRYEKTVVTEERKKFKPSLIISPVYGILNKDYQKEDIVKKGDLDNIDVQRVRDKAFGEQKKDTEKVSRVERVEKNSKPATTSVPKTTYYEETITVKAPKDTPIPSGVKSIDELLEDTAEIPNEIDRELENTLPINVTRDIPPVPETPKEVISNKHVSDEIEDTLENDLFDLIDSMYDSKED